MNPSSVHLSYEVFPAREPSTGALDDVMTSMADHQAELVSVTFGAGGTSSARSLDTVRRAAEIARCRVAAHLTCVGRSRAEVLATAERLLDAGASDLVLLRGDPPEGMSAPYRAHRNGFASTSEFVGAIRDRADQRHEPVKIVVSGYPEVHPSSPSLAHDLDLLAAKEAAGADSFTTQMCFDADTVLRYRDAVERRGISLEMSVGVMPLIPADRVALMARRCGTRIADHLLEQTTVSTEAPEATATEIAVDFIERLRREGLNRFHLYTLNRRDPSVAIASQVCEPAELLT